MGADSQLVAKVVVDNSQAIPASKAAGDAMTDALRRTELANEKVRQAEERLTAAMQTKLSAGKQVELSMAAQAAAGKPLEEELVRLQEKYARLNSAMTQAARGGRGVPTDLAAEASRVRSQIAGVESQILSAERASVGFEKSLEGVAGPLGLGGLSIGLLGAGAAAVEMSRFMSESVHIAMESEAVTRKLTTALAAQGQNTAAVRNRILEFSEATERQTTFSHDAVTGVQTQLIMLSKLSGEGLERATQATLDFATATGKDVDTAVVQVAKAIDGHTAGLQKLGISYKATGDKAKDTEGVIAALEDRFRGQAAAAGEGSGEFKKLQNTWHDIKEEIGTALLPVLTDLAVGFKDILDIGHTLANSDNPYVKFFTAMGPLGALGDALRTYREFKAELNKPIAQEQLEGESKVLAGIRAGITTVNDAIREHQREAKQGYDMTGALKADQVELDKLKAKELEQMALVEQMRNRAAGGVGPTAPTSSGEDDSGDGAAKDGASAKAKALAMAADMQRQALAASKEYVDAQIREREASDDLSLRIAQLTNEKKALLESAVREGAVNQQMADSYIDAAAAKQQEIDQIKREEEERKQLTAVHRQMLEAQLAEHATVDPLKQKLEELRLQRLALTKAIILQKGASGELTDQDKAQLAAIDAQITSTQLQIKTTDKLAEAQKRAAAEAQRAYSEAGKSIATSMGQAFGQVIAGQEKMGTAIKHEAIALTNTIIQLSIQQALASRAVSAAKISNSAGEAGAEAIASQAPLGPIGLPIGLALAAAFITAILAEQKFLKAATGGKLRGGIPGVDSIPVMAMEDENVLDRSTNRRLEAFLAKTEGGRGVQTSAQGRAPIDFHIHLPTAPVVGMTPTEMFRLVESRIIPSLIEAADSGKLDPVFARIR